MSTDLIHKTKNVAAYFSFPMEDGYGKFKTGLSPVDDGYYKDGYGGSWTALPIADTAAEIGSSTGLYSIRMSAGEMNHDQMIIKFTASGAEDRALCVHTTDSVWDENREDHRDDLTMGALLSEIKAIMARGAYNGKVILVDNQAVGAGTGKTWANAKTTIGGAMSIAVAGDIIFVQSSLASTDAIPYIENVDVKRGVAMIGIDGKGGGSFNDGLLSRARITGDGLSNAIPVLKIGDGALVRNFRIEAEDGTKNNTAIIQMERNSVFEHCSFGGVSGWGANLIGIQVLGPYAEIHQNYLSFYGINAASRAVDLDDICYFQDNELHRSGADYIKVNGANNVIRKNTFTDIQTGKVGVNLDATSVSNVVRDNKWNGPGGFYSDAGTTNMVQDNGDIVIISNGNIVAADLEWAQLKADEPSDDHVYENNLVYISGGKGKGQSRFIVDYVGATQTVTINVEWDVIPDTTSQYQIMPFHGVLVTQYGKAQDGYGWDGYGDGYGWIQLSSDASAIDNIYNGSTIFISGGTGKGQPRLITDYNGASLKAYVQPTWTITPNNTSLYKILPVGSTIVESFSVTALANINTQVKDVLEVDTHTEPDTGTPPNTPSTTDMVNYVYRTIAKDKLTFNRSTGVEQVYKNGGSVVRYKRTVSDDGTTMTKDETITGP